MSQSKIGMGAPEYIPAFDWLRLGLALTVALFHAGAVTDENIGNFAVQVFFALSGWLIGGILLDSDASALPRFYFNRAARIWAPYFFAVALVFGMSLMSEPADAHWFEYLFYDVTFTHNWFISPRIEEINADLPLRGAGIIFWSLSVEEQFYLFAPLMILFARWGRMPAMWAALAVFAIVLETFYGSIALGVLAAVLRRRFGDWHLKGMAPALFAAVFFLCVFLYARFPEEYLRIAPFAAVSAVLLLARAGKKSRIGAFAGGVSYPLYLNQWIGVFFAREIALDFPDHQLIVTVLLSVVLNLAIASLLYLAIDAQVRKRRNEWFTPARGRAAAMIAYGLIILGGAGGLLIALMRL